MLAEEAMTLPLQRFVCHNATTMSRILLAMSGGVDSSVAAHLLLEQGHEIVGVFMRHGVESPVACEASSGESVSSATEPSLLPIAGQRLDHKQGCCTAADAADARRVADRLDIPFYALNLDQEFRQIIDYFVDEYAAGRTPNPCVQCNNWIKFGKLFDYADSVGCDFVATGHYAQIACNPSSGEPMITRGIDAGKDQAYVLFGIDRSLLSRMMLPVGGYRKPRIREIAETLGLRVADKRDSQEICFVTHGHHASFVRARREASNRAGEITTLEGRVVGRHEGIEGFTIGQRKGLGGGLGERHYVIRIDAATNRVVIGLHEDLARHELTATDLNWHFAPPTSSFRCAAQIRYNSGAHAATAMLISPDRLHIRFDDPVYGVAPGQAVVCFQDDRVLGGGWIEE